MGRVIGLIVLLASLSASAVSPYGETRRLAGHTSIINALAFSPDEALIASGSNDLTVRIWEIASGKELKRLEGHTDLVNDVVFSRDGKRLFTSGMDGQARVWDVKSGELVFLLKKRNGRHIHAGTISPDGKQALLGSCDRTLELWDVEKEKMVRSIDFPWEIDSVAFAPDGKRFFVGCGGEVKDGTNAAGESINVRENAGLWIYEVATGNLVKRFEEYGVTAIQCSRDGRLIAFLGNDAIWRLDAKSLEILGQFKAPQRYGAFLDSFALSADGKKALGCFGHDSYYLDLEANRIIRSYLPFPEVILKTALSPGGRWAAVAGGGKERAVTIPGATRMDRPTPVRVFDLTDGWEPPRYSAQKTLTDLLSDVQYTPDQSVLCTRTAKGFIGVWELSTHREIGRLDISGDSRTTVFDSGKQLLRVSKRLIELYDVPGSKKVAEFPSPKSDIQFLLPSVDGKSVFIGGGTPALRNQARRQLEIDYISIPSGKAIRTYEGLEGRAVKIAQSVDSKYLFGICVRQPGSTPTLAAWDLTSGRLLWHFKPAKGEPERGTIAISKDGLVAVAWGPEAYVFEAKDGKAVATLGKSPKAVHSINFDPDTKRIWTVCGDNKIRVYEIATGKLAQTIEFGYTAWYDNRVLFRQGKPILMGFADYGVEEIPLDD